LNRIDEDSTLHKNKYAPSYKDLYPFSWIIFENENGCPPMDAKFIRTASVLAG
jgi:hypothetical protein